MGLLITGIVGIIWLALFLHWLGREEFYPIAGKSWRTKIFWGGAFLLFNPLLLLLYFIFGVKLCPCENPPKRLKPARIVVFAVFALSLLFVLPIGRLPNRPRILTKSNARKAYDLSVKATALTSSTSSSGGGNLGFESITYLDLHRIAILNNSDHPLAIKTAQKIQQWLLSAPSVDEVAYYPKGTNPDGNGRLPSIYIELDTDNVRSSPLPLSRNTAADIHFRISTLQTFTEPWQPLPLGKQRSSLTIEHQSSTLGFESYAAKYDSAAEGVLKALYAQMKSFFGKPWYSSALIPPIPGYLEGTYAPTPDFPFDANKSLSKISGYDLLIHNHTTWRFEEPRSSEEAIAAYRTALLESGWEDHSLNATQLRMQRGNETLRVYRSDNTPKKGAPVPMIARYKNSFSNAELNDALSQLLADETIPADTLLFFGRQFRESGSESVLARFRKRMNSAEPDSLQGHLELSRFWEEQGDAEQARKELLLAVNGSRLQYDGSARFPIERQAERLGDMTLIDAFPTDRELQNLGLIPLENVTTNITFMVTPEKPFGLYAFGSAYDEYSTEKQVRTYVYRVVHDPFKVSPFIGFKPLPNRHWSLVLAGNHSEGNHSWSFLDGSVSNGLWHAGMNQQLPGSANTRIRIDVHQIGDETFECTLEPLNRPVQTLRLL